MSGRRPPQRKRRPAPTPAARVVELLVREIGARGDGIAALDGVPVYIPFTVAGDRVLARIDGRRGDGLAAILVELLSPGPQRVQPACSHYGRCGGCNLQHLAEEPYRTWKTGLLTDALARQRLEPARFAPLIRCPPARRRAVFAFERDRDRITVGFNARASHAVIDLDHCPLLAPPLVAVLAPLRSLLADMDVGHGDVAATLTETGLDIVIEAEARLDLFDRERLAAFSERADLARLSWRLPGGPIEPIARRRAAIQRFGPVPVEPPPGAFTQPTKEGEDAIVRQVMGAVGEAKRVADLYAGSGSLTLPLARPGRRILAVEGEEAPARALMAAARAAGLDIEVEIRDLARRPLPAHGLNGIEALVFDPPRAGASAQMPEIVAARIPVVVAVSCNPATLARDLRILVDGGYRLDEITPIDQFPWSPHLEAVAVLRLNPCC